MALLEEIGEFAEGNAWPLAAGAAAVVVLANPRVYHTARPLLKGTIKGFLIARARLRALLTGISRQVQQVYIEAKDEADAQASPTVMASAAPEMHESAPRRRTVRRTEEEQHVTS